MPRQKLYTDHCNMGWFFTRLLWFPLLTILIVSCSTTKTTKDNFKLCDVIPNGEITVEVLELRFSKRTEELAAKMSQALATNQEWWMEYIKQHAADYPLPYHANLGLTQEEYAEYLDGAEKTRHLHKVSDASINFKRKGNLISIDLGDETSPVSKWQLNILSGELLLPTGEAIKPVWCSGNDTTQPIGAFKGYSWDYDSPTEPLSDCQIATLNIYQQEASGMIFWRIKEGEIQNSHTVRSLDVAFRYKRQ